MPADKSAPCTQDGASGSVFVSATPTAHNLPPVFPRLQDLSPASARCVLRYTRALQELGVHPGTRLVLAVSGGADSTALACLTALVRERLGLAACMLCCDHGLRPESRAEADYVQALGRFLGIACSTVTLSLDAQAPGLEERARQARYQALEAQRVACGADAIVLAHHAGDLTEDIVMRLVRGTGWPALGGMQAKESARHVLRPLLGETKEALCALLAELNIPHCEDASNAELIYTRNRLRHTIVPLLEQENPNLTDAVQHLSQLASLDAAFFEAQLTPVLAKVEVELVGPETAAPSVRLSLPEKEVRALAPSLSLRCMLALVHRLREHGVAGQARATTLFAAERALRAPQRPVLFQLPGGISLRLTGRSLMVEGRAKRKPNLEKVRNNH